MGRKIGDFSYTYRGCKGIFHYNGDNTVTMSVYDGEYHETYDNTRLFDCSEITRDGLITEFEIFNDVLYIA